MDPAWILTYGYLCMKTLLAMLIITIEKMIFITSLFVSKAEKFKATNLFSIAFQWYHPQLHTELCEG